VKIFLWEKPYYARYEMGQDIYTWIVEDYFKTPAGQYVKEHNISLEVRITENEEFFDEDSIDYFYGASINCLRHYYAKLYGEFTAHLLTEFQLRFC